MSVLYTAVDEDIRRVLDVSEVTELIGSDDYFETFADAEDAYRAYCSD